MEEKHNDDVSVTITENLLGSTPGKRSSAVQTDEIQAQVIIPSKKPWNGLKKISKIVGNLLFFCLLAMMTILVFSVVQSRLRGGPSQVAGHQMYVVLSGSMSPAFETGSLAFVQPLDPRNIKIGDIITYRLAGKGGILITHRVIQIERDGDLSFITRGDANGTNDHLPVQAANVVGKVKYTLPYAGYILNFGQSKAGILSLVIIPGVLIVIFELRNLFRLVAEWEAEKAAQKKKENSTLSKEEG